MTNRRLTELEERLAQPGADLVKQDMLRVLKDLEYRLEHSLATLATREEHALRVACLAATRSASLTLDEWVTGELYSEAQQHSQSTQVSQPTTERTFK